MPPKYSTNLEGEGRQDQIIIAERGIHVSGNAPSSSSLFVASAKRIVRQSNSLSI